MNAEALLLTDKERTAAWNEGVESGRADWIWAGAEAVVRAQAAKVLEWLATSEEETCYPWDARQLRELAASLGLTWPLKEG